MVSFSKFLCYKQIGLENLYAQTRKTIQFDRLDSQNIVFDSNLVLFYSSSHLLLFTHFYFYKHKRFVLLKIHSMIIFCREQINYFKKSLSTAFTDLLDINELVVKILYENLMRDVKNFCEIHLDELYDVVHHLIVFLFNIY